MRTTVELPDGVLRRAKARAAERGESLKKLLTRAVLEELGSDQGGSRRVERVRLPLFGSARGPRVHVRSEDLAEALSDADAAKIAATTRKVR
jgi:hypothetical protein